MLIHFCLIVNLPSQAWLLHYARDDSLITYLHLQIHRIHAQRSCQSRNGSYHHFDDDIPYGFPYCHITYTSFLIAKWLITRWLFAIQNEVKHLLFDVLLHLKRICRIYSFHVHCLSVFPYPSSVFKF